MKQSMAFDVQGLLARYRLPTRLKSELQTVCLGNVSKILSRTRISDKRASFKTQERRMFTVCRSFAELRELGFLIESPYSLAEKHTRALVGHWVSLGQAGGTIENKLSHLRAFCEWMGKRNFIQTLDVYVDRKANALERQYVTTSDKSWEGNGIDAAQKIAEIAEVHPRVAIQLKLQAAFGLRIEESFSLKIASSLRDLHTLRVVDGTKGGRERVVPIQLRLSVLQEAAQLIDPFSGSTTPAGYSIQRWRDHYNTVLRKYGIYKKGLGVTSHGLRHQWLQEYYRALSGDAAPVKGGMATAEIEVHRRALQEVVEAAGHSKASKTSAYLSTYSAMAGLERKSITPEQARDAIVAAAGNKARAASALGVSRQALYRALAKL